MTSLAPLSHGPIIHDDGTVTFNVWAPHASSVQVELRDETHAMSAHDTHGASGWFSLRTSAAPGERYGFRLDDGPTRPDPATRSQPDGVHESSELIDPQSWQWTDQHFRAAPLTSGAVYEMHMPTFTPEGTFEAAACKLAELADLGITHVEILPVNAFNGDRGWGYDGVAWYAVHHSYGGPAAFAWFVDACHAQGLAVILDVVYNHLGPSGNYLGEFGPYLTDTYTTPWGDAPNVDGPGSDAVRTYIIDNGLMWFTDYHVDGLRLDAVHGIVDISSVHLLTEMSAAADARSDALARPLQFVAETDRQDPQTVRPRAVGGHGLDAQWLDDLHHGLHVAMTGENDGYYVDYAGLPDVAAVYQRGMSYDGRYSEFRGRTVGRPVPDDVSSRQFVTCIQNHDQIGNRARGDRLTTLVSPARLRVGIALLCLSPTTPMLFMGEEFGATTPFMFFSGHPEPELDRAVREGRRAEFASFASFSGDVPDPQDRATMRASRLDWTQSETPEGNAWRTLWHDLLKLRRTEPALANGDRSAVTIHSVTPEDLVLTRAGTPDVHVVANLGTSDTTFDLPFATAEALWSSDASIYGGSGEPVTVDDATVRLASDNLVILRTH